MNPLRRALFALAATGIVMGVLMAVVIAISDRVDNPTPLAALDGSLEVESPAGMGTVLRAVPPLRTEPSIRATSE